MTQLPPAPGSSDQKTTKKGDNLRVEVRHGGLGLAQQRLQVHLVDGIHEGEPPLRVLQVLEDHNQKDGRKLPSVAARTDGVEDEVLEERGDADRGPHPRRRH